MGNDHHYGDRFWAKLLDRREAYHELARAIASLFHPRSVIEIGCGMGMVIEWFIMHEIPAIGYERSMIPRNLSPVKAAIQRADFTIDDPPLADICDVAPDLTISIEVAEHIAPAHEARFLDWVTCAPALFLTASPSPGGVDHLNVHPQAYWIKKLQARGYIHCPCLTEVWRQSVGGVAPTKVPHMLANAMIFLREPGGNA